MERRLTCLHDFVPSETLETREAKMVVRMFKELLSTTNTCVYGAWMAHTRRSVDG